MSTPPPVRPDLRQFLECRSPMAFWVTYHVNNPVGALFALASERARLTPNMVSWISLLATLSGPALLCFWHPESRAWEAVLIVASLQLGYTLDGADGMLARVTGQGSRFGGLLDKLIDSIVMLSLPPLLYFAAIGRQPTAPFGEEGIVVITFLAIISRGLLANLLWLKEYVQRGADRSVKDQRSRNAVYYLRRGIGQLTDTSTFYLILGVAWAGGWYWWWMGLYSIWITIVFTGYLGLAFRDLR